MREKYTPKTCSNSERNEKTFNDDEDDDENNNGIKVETSI